MMEKMMADHKTNAIGQAYFLQDAHALMYLQYLSAFRNGFGSLATTHVFNTDLHGLGAGHDVPES
jgi:hypothetical protein